MRKLWLNGVLSASFALAALWLLAPSRNAAGNPSFEERQDSCTEPTSGTDFTLYRGNGGATVAFWYTVTANPLGLARERQVFFSYSSPVITGLTCAPKSIELVSDPSNIMLDMEHLEDLREHPLAYWEGRTGPLPTYQAYQLVPAAAGFVSILLSLAFALRLHRCRKPAASQRT